jgi:hypothetical protein
MNNDLDLGRIREDLRGVSKELFSKQHRLEVVAAVGALDPPVWSRRLAGALGIGENQAAAEIASLVQLGALQRFPAEYDRRKIYQPVPHPIWGFCRATLEETIREAYGGEQGAVGRYWEAVLERPAPAPLPNPEE